MGVWDAGAAEAGGQGRQRRGVQELQPSHTHPQQGQGQEVARKQQNKPHTQQLWP